MHLTESQPSTRYNNLRPASGLHRAVLRVTRHAKGMQGCSAASLCAGRCAGRGVGAILRHAARRSAGSCRLRGSNKHSPRMERGLAPSRSPLRRAASPPLRPWGPRGKGGGRLGGGGTWWGPTGAARHCPAPLFGPSREPGPAGHQTRSAQFAPRLDTREHASLRPPRRAPSASLRHDTTRQHDSTRPVPAVTVRPGTTLARRPGSRGRAAGP